MTWQQILVIIAQLVIAVLAGSAHGRSRTVERKLSQHMHGHDDGSGPAA